MLGLLGSERRVRLGFAFCIKFLYIIFRILSFFISKKGRRARGGITDLYSLL